MSFIECGRDTAMLRLGGAVGRFGMGCVLAISMTLQGCAGLPTVLPTDSANDTCAPLRAPLREIVEEYNERFAVAVGGGALAGAAAGAAIGAAQGDLLTGLLIGTVVGAVGGFAVNYYQKQSQQYENQGELRRALDGDIKSATGDVRGISQAVTKLNTCRRDQLADLRKRIQNGARGEAEQAELASIRRWMDDDRRIISEVIGDIGEGNEIYADAYAQSREIDKERVAPRVARYEPQVRQPRKVADQTPQLPTVRSAPSGSNNAETLLLASKDLQASQAAQSEMLNEEIDSISLLLK